MKKISVTEQLARYLKDDILSGRYQVGDKYPAENELCQKYGVSRTTVREALRILQTVGYLQLRAGKGAFVAACTQADVDKTAASRIFSNQSDYIELAELREGIEPIIAKYAALRATKEDIYKLYGILAFFEKAYENEDILSMIEADESFHDCLAAAARNDVCKKLYEQLLPALHECKSHLFAVRGNGKDAILEHRAIADAVAEGNAQKAQETMLAHVNNVLINIQKIATTKE